tara:strand:- start:1556 stop:1669 length:114 start_codon:yes stop_codon:yes gene_type:complete
MDNQNNIDNEIVEVDKYESLLNTFIRIEINKEGEDNA